MAATGAASKRREGGESRHLNFERAFNRLCHILPLTRDGKASEALDELVVTVLVVDEDRELSGPADVATALDRLFGVRLPVEEVGASLSRACQRGKLERKRGGGYRPTPSRRAAVLDRIREGEQLEEKVRDEWIAEQVAEGVVSGPDEGERLWRALRAYMTVVFARHGALAMELLDPNAPSPEEGSSGLIDVLQGALADEGIDTPKAMSAVEQFFDHASADRSRYVGQVLDATFTFYAVTADEQVGALVDGRIPPLDVFVDTNFVFALVGLDESPESDLAREIIRVIKENALPFRLYYHEVTEQEIRRTLDGFKVRLARRRWSPEVSAAAVETKSVRGVELTYHRLNAEEGPIDPKVFMERWDHIGRQLTEEWGIGIYRTSARDAYDVEEKGKLIAEYDHFVKVHRPEPKPYETLDHDISVWLSISSRRDESARSSLHAGAVFLTLDRLFQRFDNRELRRGGPRSVVRPGQLLQVLRPLTARREDFDSRFAAAVATVEFRTMPSDYESTRPRILSYLATYKDLSKETAFKILSDDILAHRLQELEDDSDEFREAIKSKVVQINQELIEEREAVQARLVEEQRSRASELGRVRQERDATHEEVLRLRADLTDAQKEAKAERRARVESERARRDAERHHAEALEGLNDDLEAVRDEHAKLRTSVRRGVCAFVWAVVLGLAFVSSALVDWTWLDQHENRVAIHAIGAFVWTSSMAPVTAPRLWARWYVAVPLSGLVALLSQL